MLGKDVGEQESHEQDGCIISGNTEIRTVPSTRFPTIASSLAQPPTIPLGKMIARGKGALPNLVVRVFAGVYHESICISQPVLLVGAEDAMPTIHGSGPEGVKITGFDSSACVLRKLRISSETQHSALTIDGASPMIESCEVVGCGGEPVRRTLAGVVVRGSDARPVIRGCRISGHSGAGVSFSDGAQGLLSACDISCCACGVWLESGANPLLWRNTIAGHRGAGIVVRSGALGSVLGNAVLRNGAGGVLVESNRQACTKISQNRVWANIGCDLRQSPAQSGVTAGEVGALLVGNVVGSRSDESNQAPGIEMTAAWPTRVVSRGADLIAAVRGAPKSRFVVIEISGRIVLDEPLIIDRPVIISGTAAKIPGTTSELCGSASSGAVVVFKQGGEAACLWQLTIRLPVVSSNQPRPGATCVDIVAGNPSIIDCEVIVGNGGASAAGNSQISKRDTPSVPTHALRVAGEGVAPLITGCALRGASGAGVLIDGSSTPILLQCEISVNHQGGVFLGCGARLRMEACEVSRNGHFGIVIGPGSSTTYVGRTNLSHNSAGGIWHCGGQVDGDFPSAMSNTLWLDECSLSGAGPNRKSMGSSAIAVGPGADVVLWDALFAQRGSKQAAVRTEIGSRVVIARDGSGSGMSGWGHGGTAVPLVGDGKIVWLDINGSTAEQPPATLATPAPRVEIEFPTRTHNQRLSKTSYQQGKNQSVNLNNLQRTCPGQDGQLASQTVGSQSPADVSMLQVDGATSKIPALEIEIDEQEVGSEVWGQSRQTPGADNTSSNVCVLTSTEASEPRAAAEALETGTSADGDVDYGEWVRTKMAGTDLPANDRNRRILFQILSMLVEQNRCEDALDAVGLGGPIKSGDSIFLRGHTGRWLGNKNAAIVCNKPDRSSSMQFSLETKSSSLRHESKAIFKILDPETSTSSRHSRLGVTPQGEFRAVQRPEGVKDGETQFVVLSHSSGPITSGATVFLKSVGSGKILEVDGDAVRFRGQQMGTRQRVSLEKMPAESNVPSACEDVEFSVGEQAWLFRRGVGFAMIDKQQIAKFLSSHRPGCKEMIKAYTRLWEFEWRQTWPDLLGADGDADDVEVDRGVSQTSSRQSQRTPSRGRRRDWIFNRVGGPREDDKTNGNLFISALRSFFATALRMSQLEADPVQRVIEAFADALVADTAFMERFKSSMLVEAERKTYRTPEDVLFGLTYMILMLNTDTHNKQVAQKMWDTKKFVAAGKDCGVTGGLMMQIFKNVQNEEL